MKNEIDVKAIVKRLEEIAEGDDWEGGHVEADNILCSVLDALGYRQITEAYDHVHKWYA